MSGATATPALRTGPVAAIRAWIDVYVTNMRIAIASQIQYRVSNYFYMIGMIA